MGWHQRSVHAKFDGIVCIVRNPWNAMWSVFQLWFSHYQSHTARIKKNEFDADRFYEFLYLGAGELSACEMWKRQFTVIDFLYSDALRIVYIQYENLLDKMQRVAEIMKIINHLYKLMPINTSNETQLMFPLQSVLNKVDFIEYEALIDRIECAFNYTNSKKKNKNIYKRDVANETFISMNEAYSALGRERICKIWHSLKTNAERFGYKQLFYEQYRCEDEIYWDNIVNVDNVNRPNMTRYRLYKEREDKEIAQRKRKKQQLAQLKKKNQTLNSQTSHN